MQENLDDRVAKFTRKYGMEGVGHVTDVTDAEGRRTVLLSDR